MTDVTLTTKIPDHEVITDDFRTVLSASMLGDLNDKEQYQKTLAFYREHDQKKDLPYNLKRDLEESAGFAFWNMIEPVLRRHELKYEPPKGERREIAIQDYTTALVRGRSFGSFFPVLGFHFNETGDLVAQVSLCDNNWEIAHLVCDVLTFSYSSNPARSQGPSVVRVTDIDISQLRFQGQYSGLGIVPFSQTTAVLQYAAGIEQMLKPSVQELGALKQKINELKKPNDTDALGFPLRESEQSKTISAELRKSMLEQVRHKYLETLLKALGREFDP